MSIHPFLERPQVTLQRVVQNIEKVIIGKTSVIEQLLIACLAGGHVLFEDVPGVGKTMLVKALARSVDLQFQRIQFTPDMLPADLTGVSVYHRQKESFEYKAGPIIASIVLADELNRASPRTQAALLEAMEERAVTVDGQTHRLPEPFIVLATQNPLDYEGTYHLPEAQLDRFMMKLRLGYPELEQEIEMLERMERKQPLDQLKPVLWHEEFRALQHEVTQVYVDASIRRYIVQLSEATRTHEEVAAGASPRASFALMRAGQACAYLHGRNFVIPDDIKALLVPCYAHRLVRTPEASMRGVATETILMDIASHIHPPVSHAAAGS